MAETTPTVENDGDEETTSKHNITMTVDAPVEERKNEVADNEKNEVEEFKICSSNRAFVKPPQLQVDNPIGNKRMFGDGQSEKETNKTDQNSNGAVHTDSASLMPSTSSADESRPSRGILKPSQLTVSTSFALTPSRLQLGTSSKSTADKNSLNGESTPKFVPLIQSGPKTNSNTAPSTTANANSGCSFVFGQNLQERVISPLEAKDEPKPSTSVHANGTEMLFSAAVKNDAKANIEANSKDAKSLSESAREYEESRANKRKYEEVEVITGEEGETNIVNTTCKLFAFDKASGSWQERGRGVLRLNDLKDESVQSRLVFRTTGSLRVVLNTKIWADMTVERASEKSIRFTAMDANGVIKVFLAMAGIEDIKQLYAQLHQRVQNEIASQKHRKVSE